MELSKFVASAKNSKLDISRLCTVKKYLPVQEKITLIQEYYDIVADMLGEDRYIGAESLVAFVVFNLLVVKKYTNIDLEISFESMDLLQENDLIGKIASAIGQDYQNLIKFIRMQ